MKKIIVLILVMLIGISFCGCGNNDSKSEEKYVIGKAVTNGDYRYTVKSAELTKGILVCTGEDIRMNTFIKSEDFFTPYNESFTDENGYVKEGIHGFGAGEGKVFLYYNIEFEYLGKEETTVANLEFAPEVVFGKDYKFNSDYFTFYREKTNSKVTDWANFQSDFNSISTVRALGLEIGYFSGKIEPLSSSIFELRGVITLPEKVANDTNESVVFNVLGDTFIVR